MGELDTANPVVVHLSAQWASGSSAMKCDVSFTAQTLDEALRMIRGATDAAPIFKPHFGALEEE